MAVPTMRPAMTVEVWRGRRIALRAAMRARMGRRAMSTPTATAEPSAATTMSQTHQGIIASVLSQMTQMAQMGGRPSGASAPSATGQSQPALLLQLEGPAGDDHEPDPPGHHCLRSVADDPDGADGGSSIWGICAICDRAVTAGAPAPAGGAGRRRP